MALLVFSIVGLLTMAPTLYAADGSGTWVRSIRDANLESLVFIAVTARRANHADDHFTGTGFIVHPAGYVLTCNHVIPAKKSDYTEIESTGSIGGRYEQSFPLTIVRRDEQGDVMLLKLPQRKDPWRSVRSIAEAQRDSEIVALGFPLEKDLVEAVGLITGVDRDGRWLTNAGLIFGMSGGPAFDRSGAVIGIVAGGYEEAKSLDLIIPISSSTGLLQYSNSPLLQQSSQGPTYAKPANRLRRFESEGFAISAEGFNVQRKDPIRAGQHPVTVLYLTSTSGGIPPNVTVVIVNFPGSISEYAARTKEAYDSMGVKIINERTASPNEWVLEYTGTQDDLSLHLYSRAVKDGDIVYLTTASAMPEQWNQVSHKLRQCVDSFSLLNSSEP
jgi:serine protease Do